MEFDTTKGRALIERFRSIPPCRGSAPPLEVLHPFMLLAGTDPEHLIGEYLTKVDDFDRWNIVALDSGMLTLISAAGTDTHGWSLESLSWGGANHETTNKIDARTMPFSAVKAVRVADTQRRGRQTLENVYGQWELVTGDSTIVVPGGTSEAAEQFATVVLTALRDKANR